MSKDSTFIQMTTEPIPPLIIRLAIPTIINMLVTNIYNMVDTAFVGRLGNSASGAVGVVFGFMSIIQAIGFMFGQGSGSICSRMLGSKEDKKASSVASAAFFVSILLGVLLSVMTLLFLDNVVFFLGATATIAPYAKKYIFYILLATPAMCASFTMNNILRYEGKAFIGMIGLISGALLNIAGDAIFMFGLNMGIAGAGLSTAISQYVSFFILMYVFISGKTVCKIKIGLALGGMNKIVDVILTGLPSLLRQGLNSLSTVMLNFVAASYGDEAVAAFSIVSRIAFFVFSIGLGMGQGYQPVSGYNYGAGKYSRIRQGYRFTYMVSQVLLIVISTFVMIFHREILFVFRDDINVVNIASRALILQCISQFVLPFCVVTEMQLQSTGQKMGAIVLSICRAGVFFLPTLFLLAHTRGLTGIQEAQPIATVLAIIPAIYFARKFFSNLPTEDVNG